MDDLESLENGVELVLPKHYDLLVLHLHLILAAVAFSFLALLFVLVEFIVLIILFVLMDSRWGGMTVERFLSFLEVNGPLDFLPVGLWGMGMVLGYFWHLELRGSLK